MLNKLAMGVPGLALCGPAMAAQWKLQPVASILAGNSHDLHQWVVALVTFIFVGVFGFMFWSIYAHRKAVGHKAAHFHKNVGVEIAWTVIPMIILVIIAWPVAKSVLAHNDASNADSIRSQCIELCGEDQGFLPIVVRVVSTDDYSRWMAAQRKIAAALADDPKRSYGRTN